MRAAQRWTVTAGRAFVLGLTGAALGLAIAAARPGGLHLAPHPRAASCEAPTVEPKRITPADAAKLCADREVLVADARSASDFTAGHIANAVHLPCDAAGDVAAQALAKLGSHKKVIVYGTSTEDALTVARSIAQRSSIGVYALEGGFAAWEQAGLACASGPCESCAVNRSAPESP
ncbi:MAG: rhodanese-like domain-containing protein [Polyangia bacterium]